MVWMVIGGGVVVIVLAVLLSRARVPHDGVDNFRRQIDALSPEARRPVVGRVNEARQTTRDHGLTVRRVTPITPTSGVDASQNDHHPELDDDSADRRTGQESGRASDADAASGHRTGGDSGSAAGDDGDVHGVDGVTGVEGDAAGESLDGS